MSNVKQTADTAQLNEAHLRVMLQQLPAVLWTTDRDLRFTSSLGKSLEQLNLQPNEVVGLTLYEFFQTEDSGFPPIAAHLKALAGQSASFEQEWGCECFSSYVEPLRNDQGQIIGCLGLARETTEHKRFERELRESQQKSHRRCAELESLYRTAPVGLCVIDAQMRYVSINDELATQNGTPAKDHIGKTIHEIIPEAAESIELLLQEVLKTGQPRLNLEVEGVTPANPDKVQSYLMSCHPICNGDGVVQEISTVVQNITELKEAEKQIHDQEKRFRELAEGAIQGITVYRDHEVVYVNEACARMHGYTTEEVYGMGECLQLIAEHDRERLCKYARDRLAGAPAPTRYEFQGLHKDGSLMWLENNAVVVHWDGHPVVQIATVDISVGKQSEQLLNSGNRILRQIVRGEDLNETLATLVSTAESLVIGARVAVMLLDREQERLRVGLAPRLPAFFAEAIDGMEIGPDQGGCGAAAYHRKRMIIKDILDHPNCVQLEPILRKANVRACWSEPIFDTKEQVVGILAYYHSEPKEPNEYDLELTQSAAHLAGIAIERNQAETSLREAKDQLERRVTERTEELMDANGQLQAEIAERKNAEDALQHEQKLLERLLNVQDRERRLLAYEIHDGLVQQIAGALMHLQTVEGLRESNPAQADVELKRAIELSSKSVDEARRVISGLRPPVLDELGIIAAIEYLVNETREVVPSIEFRHQASFERLAIPLENAMFRITQEALSNVSRHSKARVARVELIENQDHVRLKIRDWGCGFDPTSVTKDRFGLQGIRERARLLGSYASIESEPGKGAIVVVDFPLFDDYRQPSSAGNGR